jgi:hypothetical protein
MRAGTILVVQVLRWRFKPLKAFFRFGRVRLTGISGWQLLRVPGLGLRCIHRNAAGMAGGSALASSEGGSVLENAALGGGSINVTSNNTGRMTVMARVPLQRLGITHPLWRGGEGVEPCVGQTFPPKAFRWPAGENTRGPFR